MENYKIEKEYKMMLKEAEFELLLSKLPPHEVRIQSNFYYTASNNMGMRIRYLNDKYYFTLKHFINNEVREYEWELLNNDINDPSITKLLNELHVDSPRFLGELKTIRHLFIYDKGELCLDENEYLGVKDYELEYELFNPEVDDFKTLESILELGKLNFITNKITKYQRFKDRLKEVSHD